ncbi:sulfite reductase (NADPH) flavoprotein alpha-component [Dyadobacter jejuensis]|uniref:Sulfite reductase (NADPH) flavoprotein alpha-component n=1 Tax=Dyadobacter jejuensis TaxID=1082580 RepID=A0A316ASZ6_9BACT|nr:PepSY domain-containing protein [Dyadobacter jejuensis]PWJ60466.1 sulfite reductase (NADPH) flavoprotein alpha-component [Dyadobacter jejuensis]
MTISIWRYSHLALAVSSFILLTLASITGIILAFKPIQEKLQPYRTESFENISLAEVIPQLRKQYPGVSNLSVDANQFVLIKGMDQDGENLLAYVNPTTGALLGEPEAPSEFFEWVTALHRSLFLHETGRFFIGLTSFLLLLITISGAALVVQRQRGWKRFFTSIVRENFAQYYHVVWGRLSLLPICIIALTGTYLSLARFQLIDTAYILPDVDYDSIQDEPALDPTLFEIFTKTPLADLQSIDFPFSDDVEDYYTLKLKDRELNVNQVTGEVLSEVRYPMSVILTELSLDLHTGKTNSLWAILLALASGNILFFIYSGFAITIKRRAGRVRNKHTPRESEYILLVGSENGSTFRFANAIQEQLIAQGKKVYVSELNNYQAFPRAKHIVVLTATYGLGNPPTNSLQFAAKLAQYPQAQSVSYSVVGFGSHAYPDFCKFAFEVDHLLSRQEWAVPLVEIQTVHDKSPDEFGHWAGVWAQHAAVSLTLPASLMTTRQDRPHTLVVTERTTLSETHDAFRVRLRPQHGLTYRSGDLLSVYPADDHRERQYSIGKVAGEVQLSVKLHPGGLGSEYLYALQPGDSITARIDENPHFHFPQKAQQVLMVSNGTGIAPFLGMIDECTSDTNIYLYCGFRDHASFSLYRASVEDYVEQGKLSGFQLARSREDNRYYVKDLLQRDESLVIETLEGGGVIMLCGSLDMQKDVVELLETICQHRLHKSVSYYQSHGQILMDCY